ncbi:IMP dehydrogenase [Corynebacterium sp. 13CS0277]|uniref:zinc-dependent alcohol dehydrogenase family protein n=1 Tax=Corynebacterium sp. 13CS0277 TaxID=2071994 RepID=UPI000D02C60B|nr:zinc-dependent alcohol dehydrogenase family protein [Corynebacterium sp. 13CS0277]PRQ11360.1 IMP dehydrogenase [Corynebacterium sp. 13CS0277]
MRAVIMNRPGVVSIGERPMPVLEDPRDAIIKIIATCVCGSDLWPYRGIGSDPVDADMGHEYVGEVVEVGDAVRTVAPGDIVVGSFCYSCGECEICQAGYQSRCPNGGFTSAVGGTQAEYARIPLADGTLVATPGRPTEEQLASLLAASDVLGTGWFAADAAGAKPGATIAVVGDGAVGLCAVLAAKQLGAERIIAFSSHPDRAALAREFGATDIITTRGDEGVAELKALTEGLGAHGTAECVGTESAMQQAMAATRPGGYVGFVGVPHGGSLDMGKLFFSELHLHGGPAPVRRYLPTLIDLIYANAINPGKVFDLTVSLDDAAEAYRAMDERTAIKAMLLP